MASLLYIYLILSSLETDIHKEIYGSWQIEETVENQTIFKRVNKLRKKKRQFGFSILADGEAIIRTNASGCAVMNRKGKTLGHLDQVKGSWKKVNEKTILLKCETFVRSFERTMFYENGKMIEKHNPLK